MIENIKPTDRIVVDVVMQQIDINPAKMRDLKQQVAKKYGLSLRNVFINPKPIMVDDNGKTVSLTNDIITNIQDPKFQQKLFKEYIDIKKIEDVDFERILDIDNKVNAFVDFDSYSKYKSYKFKYVKWKNFLSYGEDNYIDFTKLHGLVLLCGNPQNQSGKTSLARNLLRFALFGRSEKTPNLSAVFNKFIPSATEMMVEVGIEIDGDTYVIRRTVTRPAENKRTAKSKCKQSVDYFKLTNGELELIENCEDESTQQTNNNIKESIGSLEDFDLIVSATAKTLGDLFSMGQTDQGKLFSRWLGLLSLEEKETIAKDIYKKNIEPSLLSSRYNKATINDEIENMKVVIGDNESNIKKLAIQIDDINKELEKSNKERDEKLHNRREVKEELSNIDVTTVHNSLTQTSEKLEYERAKFSQQKDEWEAVKDITFNPEDLKVREDEKLKITYRNGELKQDISARKANIAHINDLLEKGICPNCKSPVDVKLQKDIIASEEEEINKLIQEGVNNKNRLDVLVSEISKLEDDREKVNLCNKLKLSMTAIHAQIQTFKLQIESYNRTIEDIEKNKENIEFNSKITTEIRLIDEVIRTNTSTKETYIKTIQSYEDEIKRFNNDIKVREELIVKLTDEEKLIRAWSIYKELIGKNGILKIVLKRALPIINNEIASLLNGLVDFEVALSISDDSKVCIDLIRDGVTMSVGTAASGYEETMASLALRSALATVSSFAKPNLLVLDEIFGATGSSHYDDIRELLNRIMKNHDFIIDITHNEMIMDWHEQIIEVVKDNNISKITVR